MTRLVNLVIENVMRLKAFAHKPKENVITISGRNDQGKSSAINSIEMLFAGKRAHCDQPVRKGQKKATIIGELDDGLVIHKVIKKDGSSSLVVTDKDGVKLSSPQTLLDKLYGVIAFDPLAFTRMPPQKQREIVQAIAGLDFRDADKQRQALHDKRTDINREVKRLMAYLESIPDYPDAPAEEVSVSDLMIELGRRRKVNEENERTHKHLYDQRDYMDRIANDIQKRREEIEQLQRANQQAENNLKEAKRIENDLAEKVAATKDENEEEIQEQIREADGINAKVRANHAHASARANLEKAQNNTRSISRAIEKIDRDKEEAIAKADFPIKGLAFDEDGVLYDGLPFNQAGSAAQLRISVAMSAAMNPKLRVILIRDGSLMDEESRALLRQLAEEHDLQVWMEVVSDNGDGCSVVIEDGEVKGGAP